MASGPRRPGFYLGVLITGFLLGGYFSAILRHFLPPSAARDFFGWSVTGSVGPVSVDLLVLHFTLGPVGVDVTLLSLVGVLIAYFVARSLF